MEGFFGGFLFGVSAQPLYSVVPGFLLSIPQGSVSNTLRGNVSQCNGFGRK